VAQCGVADILCLGNDDIINAGVQLRGKAWPGTVLCFFPGTLVSFMVCENCVIDANQQRLITSSQFPSKYQQWL
jgi:hypothetical protein